jgi:hypothetical protein
MCKYIKELDRFKKYRNILKRKTKDILNSKNPLEVIKKYLGIENSSENNMLYIFYRTKNNIYNSVNLNLHSSLKKSTISVQNFIDNIVDVPEAYIEIYMFDSKYHMKEVKLFYKLTKLIIEFCNINKIEDDYHEHYISGFISLGKTILLDTYVFIGKHIFKILGLFIILFISNQYIHLINAGYPIELIDFTSVVLLSRMFIYYTFVPLGILIIFMFILQASLDRLFRSKEKGNLFFKRSIGFSFYVIIFLTIYFYVSDAFHINKNFLKSYNSIHLLPRIIVDNNMTYRLVIGNKNGYYYSYNLDTIIDTKIKNKICKDINVSLEEIKTIIMFESLDVNNIDIHKNKYNLLHDEKSKKNITDKYCNIN